MNCPEPEQAVVGGVRPVDGRVDVLLNGHGHGDHAGCGVVTWKCRAQSLQLNRRVM